VREPLGHVVELVDEVVRWAPGTVGDAEDQPAGVAEDPRRWLVRLADEALSCSF